MARQREFDVDEVLQRAMGVFWRKGFAGTSTDDLLEAMGIGRQSLYNTFGDKKALYLKTLEVYQDRMIRGHLSRLNGQKSPLKGIKELLTGLFSKDDELRSMGCMGVGSVAEFGTADPDLIALWSRASPLLSKRLIERVEEGQSFKEIDPSIRPEEAAGFVQTLMAGLQIAARGGADFQQLRKLAMFGVDRLKAEK